MELYYMKISVQIVLVKYFNGIKDFISSSLLWLFSLARIILRQFSFLFQFSLICKIIT